MRKYILLLLCVLALSLAGCGGGGGGGGGGGIRLSGTLLAVGTGLPPNPAATVTAGGVSGTTSLADGTFSINVPSGTSSITMSAAGFTPITYTFPPVTTSTDLGFLFIGPQVISVLGRVIDAQTSADVPGAVVTFLGNSATTAANGTYNLPSVAYDPNGLVQLVMHVAKTGYIPRDLPVDAPVIGGQMVVPDIQLAPESDNDPPITPSNIYGFITESGGDGSAVLVTLVRRSDQVVVSQFVTGTLTNGPLNQFVFWVPAAGYTLKFEKPFGTSRGQTDVDLLDVGTPVRKDFTLQ